LKTKKRLLPYARDEYKRIRGTTLLDINRYPLSP